MKQVSRFQSAASPEGTRGGRLKAPPIMVYPSSELERELIVLAARLTGGRRPSISAFLIDAALTRIRALPAKSPAIETKLAELHATHPPSAEGQGESGDTPGPPARETGQGTIARIAASTQPPHLFLTIAVAKEGLAHSFGITPAEVQITIRA